MKRRWLIVLFVLAALYAGYRLTLHWMVEAKLNGIRKQGYPVTLAELNKWYRQPPPGENAAGAYVEAFSNLTAAQRSDADLPMVGYGKLPKLDQPMSDVTRKAVTAHLARNTQALTLLHQGAQYTLCRYPVDLTKWFDDQNPHLASLQRAARLLGLEAIDEAGKEEPEKAAGSLASCLALAKSLDNEPHGASHFCQTKIVQTAARSLECVLNNLQLDSGSLNRLDAGCATAEASGNLRPALVGHACMANEGYNRDPWSFISSGGVTTTRRWNQSELPWFYRVESILFKGLGIFEIDQLSYLRGAEKNLNSTALPFPQIIGGTARGDYRFSAPLPFFAGLLLGEQEWMVMCEADARAYLGSARALIAVEQRRLATNQIPEASFKLPQIDPFTGQSLRYKKLAKGYMVYSVGEDGVDDGGATKDITFTVER